MKDRILRSRGVREVDPDRRPSAKSVHGVNFLRERVGRGGKKVDEASLTEKKKKSLKTRVP